jgi:phage shock protein A
MGKAKQKMSENADAMKRGIDKAGDKVDEMTGKKYSEKIDKGADKAQERIDSMNSQQPKPQQQQ